MNINFETLKTGFIAYLESIEKESDTQDENSVSELSDVSIFLHAREFKEYVSDELNVDLSDIPMDFAELMEMEVVNGELVNKEELEEKEQNEQEENSETLENTGKIENKDLVTNFLNDLLKDTEIIKGIDSDGDSLVNTEEALNFFKFISKNDENNENISFEDIFIGIEQLEKGEYNPKTLENIDEKEINETEIETEETEEPKSEENSTSSEKNSGGGGGGGNSLNNISPSTKKNEVKEESYEDKSLDELSEYKSNYQTKMNDARDDISSIFSGTNSAVKAAEESLTEKKSAYDEAVKNDKKISESLKKEREDNLKSLEEKEKSVDNFKLGINDKDKEITNKDNEISSKKSDLSALQSSLSKLESSTSDDPEIQAAINAQKQSVQEQITKIEEEIKVLEGEKTTLENDKKGLEEKLKQEEDSLSKLEETRTDIENRIMENSDEETQLALKDFNDAKNNVNTVKEKELQAVEKTLNAVETELDKIQEAYNTKKAAQIKKDNHISTSKLFDETTNLVSEKVNKDGIIPYILIGPENADPNEELPVLVYMHGTGERNKTQDALLNTGPAKIISEWDLENFNGYILCPQLTNGYYLNSWNNETAANYIENMLKDFEQTHAIDNNNVAVAGHSLGGMGALYMAKHMDDRFTKAAVISGYDIGVDTRDINIPIIGYVGKNETHAPMNGVFKDKLGEEYLIEVDAHHGNAPTLVFTRDTDGNGRSDIIEWLFNDKDYEKEIPD